MCIQLTCVLCILFLYFWTLLVMYLFIILCKNSGISPGDMTSVSSVAAGEERCLILIADWGSLPVCQKDWASCRAPPCLVFPGKRSSWRPSPCCWSAPLWRPCEVSSPTEGTPVRSWRCSQRGPRVRAIDLLHSRSRRSPPLWHCWILPQWSLEDRTKQ